MFSAFRRPSTHAPHSTTSSQTGSSSAGSSSARSPEVSTSGGYDSDAVDHRSKSVRWNPAAARLGGMKQPANSSGYATDGDRVVATRHRSTSTSTASGGYVPAVPGHQRSKLSTSSIPSSGSGTGADEFQGAVDRLLRIATRPFAITGTVPLFSPISLFFQTQTGSCHLLRFPSESSIPSRTFDAFLASSEPISTSSRQHHTFRSSPSRPLTTSFDLSSHPILDTVQRTLFPSTQGAATLVASLNRVDVYCPGSSSSHSPPLNEDVVGQVVVTLPVRFRGGLLSVTNSLGAEERFWGRGTLSASSSSSSNGASFAALGDGKKVSGSLGNIEWVAYGTSPDPTGTTMVEQKVDKVDKGVRINLVYDVCLRGSAYHTPVPRPLITPNDNLLAALSSVLKRSRGMKLAFYLTNDYNLSPSHVTPETILPSLKGSDLSLYHALKFYNLLPTPRYLAGGFIWPAGSVAGISPQPQFIEAMKRLALKSAGDDEDLTIQIEEGGGVPLEREGIVVVTGKEQGRIGRERMAFLEAKGSRLEYLHVNVCLVVYVH